MSLRANQLELLHVEKYEAVPTGGPRVGEYLIDVRACSNQIRVVLLANVKNLVSYFIKFGLHIVAIACQGRASHIKLSGQEGA